MIITRTSMGYCLHIHVHQQTSFLGEMDSYLLNLYLINTKVISFLQASVLTEGRARLKLEVVDESNLYDLFPFYFVPTRWVLWNFTAYAHFFLLLILQVTSCGAIFVLWRNHPNMAVESCIKGDKCIP